MPDEEATGSVADALSPEAFVEELKKAGYDNPEVYVSSNQRRLFNLRICAERLPNYPTTIHSAIDGDVLWDALVESVFYFLSLDPDLNETLEKHGNADLAEFRQQTERYPEFMDFRVTQFRFFLRHFPDILLMAYNIAIVGSFTGPLLSVFRQRPDSDLNEMEKLARSVLEKQIDAFGKYVKQIVETRSKGRPPGSIKAQEEKEKEKKEFEERIEVAIQDLLATLGQMPTKTAVAKTLGIGGLNRNTGVDSSLTAFNNKLKRLRIDYNLIVERVKLNK